MQNANIREVKTRDTNTLWKSPIGQLFEILLVTAFILFLSGAVSAYENPQQKWTKTDSGYGGVYPGWDAYTATTVGYFGAYWLPSRNTYEFTFRATGVGETRWHNNGAPANACRYQILTVKETYNNAHQAIWTSTDPKYIGAWPHDGVTADYSQAAWVISSAAIGAINSYAGFALTIGEFIVALANAYDTGYDGETLSRTWNYDDETDVGHFFWWLVDVDPNQRIKFSVNDDLVGPGYEGIGVGWTFTCITPSAPDKMSTDERKKYGIEKIPMDEVRARVNELNIAPESVEELSKSGERFIYYAHNLPVKAVHNNEPSPFATKILEELYENQNNGKNTSAVV